MATVVPRNKNNARGREWLKGHWHKYGTDSKVAALDVIFSILLARKTIQLAKECTRHVTTIELLFEAMRVKTSPPDSS